MDGMEIIFLVLIAENILLIALNWNNLLQFLIPQDFLWIEILNSYGDVKTKKIWKRKIVEDKITIDKFEYNLIPTSKSKNGSKYYRYDEQNPIPKEEKQEVKTSLDRLLKDKELNAWQIFKEPVSWQQELLKSALPFIMGAILGGLIMTMHWQNQYKIISGGV